MTTHLTIRPFPLPLAIAMVFVLVGVAFGDEESPLKPVRRDPLDERLKQSLDADLLDGLGEVPAPISTKSRIDPKREKPDGSTVPGKNSLPKEIAGEDLGSEEPNPLVRIERRMRSAQKLLSQGKVQRDTQSVQQEIAADLKQLVDQFEQMQQSPGGKMENRSQLSSTASPPPPTGSGEKKPGSAGETASNQGPSQNSTNRIGESPTQAASAREIESLQRHAWGNLPERMRQQLGSAASEEFLPQYKGLIEEYFRRLAASPD